MTSISIPVSKSSRVVFLIISIRRKILKINVVLLVELNPISFTPRFHLESKALLYYPTTRFDRQCRWPVTQHSVSSAVFSSFAFRFFSGPVGGSALKGEAATSSPCQVTPPVALVVIVGTRNHAMITHTRATRSILFEYRIEYQRRRKNPRNRPPPDSPCSSISSSLSLSLQLFWKLVSFKKRYIYTLFL